MCSAPKAQHFHHQPGQRPRVLSHPERASAESAIHLRNNPMHPPIEARFQRCLHGNLDSWGDAPGSHETAPVGAKGITVRKTGISDAGCNLMLLFRATRVAME